MRFVSLQIASRIAMRPNPSLPCTGELFCPRLDEQLNMRHPLIRLAGLMDWEQITPNHLQRQFKAVPIICSRFVDRSC